MISPHMASLEQFFTVDPDLFDNSEWDDQCTVFCGNLPARCKEEELIQTLSKLGWSDVVSNVSLPLRDSRPGKKHQNRGYAFVCFNSPLAAESFLAAMVYGFRVSARSSSKVVLVERGRGCFRRNDPMLGVIGDGTGSAQATCPAFSPSSHRESNLLYTFPWQRAISDVVGDNTGTSRVNVQKPIAADLASHSCYANPATIKFLRL